MFLFFPFTVTFTFTLSIFTVLISKSLVCRVAVAGEELAWTPRVGVAMHVSLLRRQRPVTSPVTVLLRHVTVVVIHLVYGRLVPAAAAPAAPLLAGLLLGGGGGRGGESVGGRAVAASRFLVKVGGWSGDPQRGTRLLGALLGLQLMFRRQTLPVRQVGGGGRPVCRFLGLGAAGPGAEYREQDGQQEQTVEEAERDDEEDHLEEGNEDVRWSDHEADHPEDSGDGSL